MEDGLVRFRELNEQLDLKKAELLRRADELIAGGGTSARSAHGSSPRSGRGSSPVSARRNTNNGSNNGNIGSFSPEAQQNVRLQTPPSSGSPNRSRTGLLNMNNSLEGSPLRHSFEDSNEQGFNDILSGSIIGGKGNVGNNMGPEATSRFLIAKNRLLTEEVSALHIKLKDREEKLVELNAQLSDHIEREAHNSKAFHGLQAQVDKLKKSATEATENGHITEQQLVSLRKELDRATKSSKSAEQERASHETRLLRALEDVERLKNALKDAQSGGKDDIAVHRRTSEKYAAECKRLEKLNNELLTIIRKQFRFIDVLKQAKMHSEAAQLLRFTEEEFARILEFGDKL